MNENFAEWEELFGFHSEYYVNPRWWEENEGFGGESGTTKGYTRISEYKDDIYFVYNHGRNIVQHNPVKQTSSAIQLENKEDYDYLAVNCHGYFLYNEQSVTLYGFDGEKRYTYKYEQKKPECIYIYDSKVFYSNTKGTHAAILCVDMLTKDVQTIWSMEKGDNEFDCKLRDMYVHKYGEELPFFPNPSNIGGMSCRFLYANAGRIIAGYIRCKGESSVSYILNIDRKTRKWNILDCYAKKLVYQRPLVNDKFVFSFDMQKDAMWVKCDNSDGGKINLVCSALGKNSGQIKQVYTQYELTGLGHNGNYIYFNGSCAYRHENFSTYRISNNGMEKSVYRPSNFQTDYFWSFGDTYVFPAVMSAGFCFYNTLREKEYSIVEYEIDKLIENAKPLQPNKPQPSVSQNYQTTQRETFCELEDKEISIMSSAKKVGATPDSSAAVVIFGEVINEKNAADSYVQVIRRILERYPSLVGEWEAGITYDANRYTGSHKTIQLNGMTVYINTGNNTNVKRKNLQKLLQMAGEPADQVRFYE